MTFEFNGRKTKIRKIDILYIESDFHDIHIITLDEEYIYRSTLKKILEKLDSYNFIRIQKSIIVNLDYVKEIDSDNNMILRTGNIFSINRHYKKSAIEAYENHLLKC